MRTDARVKIERILKAGLTVQDLIEELSFLPPDAIPVFKCSYGDHGCTQQLLPICSVTELDYDEGTLEETAYSDSKVAYDEYPSSKHEDEEERAEREAESVPVDARPKVVFLEFD